MADGGARNTSVAGIVGVNMCAMVSSPITPPLTHMSWEKANTTRSTSWPALAEDSKASTTSERHARTSVGSNTFRYLSGAVTSRAMAACKDKRGGSATVCGNSGSEKGAAFKQSNSYTSSSESLEDESPPKAKSKSELRTGPPSIQKLSTKGRKCKERGKHNTHKFFVRGATTNFKGNTHAHGVSPSEQFLWGTTPDFEFLFFCFLNLRIPVFLFKALLMALAVLAKPPFDSESEEEEDEEQELLALVLSTVVCNAPLTQSRTQPKKGPPRLDFQAPANPPPPIIVEPVDRRRKVESEYCLAQEFFRPPPAVARADKSPFEPQQVEHLHQFHKPWRPEDTCIAQLAWWFSEGTQRTCVVTGPHGVGKQTLVRLVAKRCARELTVVAPKPGFQLLDLVSAALKPRAVLLVSNLDCDIESGGNVKQWSQFLAAFGAKRSDKSPLIVFTANSLYAKGHTHLAHLKKNAFLVRAFGRELEERDAAAVVKRARLNAAHGNALFFWTNEMIGKVLLQSLEARGYSDIRGAMLQMQFWALGKPPQDSQGALNPFDSAYAVVRHVAETNVLKSPRLHECATTDVLQTIDLLVTNAPTLAQRNFKTQAQTSLGDLDSLESLEALERVSDFLDSVCVYNTCALESSARTTVATAAIVLASRLKPRNTQCRFFKIEREPFRENKVHDFLKTARITSSVAPWLGFHPFEILERLQHLTTEHLFGLRESVAFKGVSVHESGTKNSKVEAQALRADDVLLLFSCEKSLPRLSSTEKKACEKPMVVVMSRLPSEPLTRSETSTFLKRARDFGSGSLQETKPKRGTKCQ